MATLKKRKTSSFRWSPERRKKFEAKKYARERAMNPLPFVKVSDEMVNDLRSTPVAIQGESKFYSHIDNPIGYTKGQIEVIDFIEDKQLNLHLGNAIQYIVRSPYKGGRDDLRKAIWYLQREIYRQERELR